MIFKYYLLGAMAPLAGIAITQTISGLWAGFAGLLFGVISGWLAIQDAHQKNIELEKTNEDLKREIKLLNLIAKKG